MSGRRFSRSVLPAVGQRVMTKLGTRAGEVLEVFEADGSAVVRFSSDPPVRMPVAHLYDATGLLAFDTALSVFRGGTKLDYVIPGSIPFPVIDMYAENGKLIVEIGSRGVTRVLVKPFAPRFAEVPNAS